MRVTRLAFKDVGPFEDAVFEIPDPQGRGELVLFEGPNGSGKTTIVEALSALAGTFAPEETIPTDRFSQKARSASASIAVHIFFPERTLQIQRVRSNAGVGYD